MRPRGRPRSTGGGGAAIHGRFPPDTFGEWIDADRERLHHRAEQVLARLIDLCEREHAVAAAIEHAQQLLRLNPLHEHVWCALMRSHAGRGERGAALHAYQQCAAILKKELGVQPGLATRMTYRDVLDLDAATLASPPRTAVAKVIDLASLFSAGIGVGWTDYEGICW